MLENVKVTKEMDRDTLISVARTSLRTKLSPEVADVLTEVAMCVSLLFMMLFMSFCGPPSLLTYCCHAGSSGRCFDGKKTRGASRPAHGGDHADDAQN